MKVAKWFYLGVPVLLGLGMLLASQPKDKKLPTPQEIKFKYNNSWSGRPLTSGESTTVAQAIHNIATAPPGSITYRNAAGSTITVSCSTLAAALKAQQDSGQIQAETLNAGSDGGEYEGEINVKDSLLGVADTSAAGMKYLEELLIHEETHKGSHQDTQGTDANEIEAHAAELAYKDSIGLDSANSADYRWTLKEWKRYRYNYVWGLIKRMFARIWFLRHICFIEDGEYPAPDMFKSYGVGDADFYEFDLGFFLRASDMMGFENYEPFGSRHTLVLICGGEPVEFPFTARILPLDIYEGEVWGELPMLDFTVPPYDPMFFYTMAYWSDLGRYYFVDTLNHQVVTMPDWDGNLIPDMEELSTFASAFWSGFEPLYDMRSVEPTMHRYHGFGLIVNNEDVHYTDNICPYDERFFLADWDGDNVADECLPAYRFEFLSSRPRIHVRPWAGEDVVMLFGSWDHSIEVWATDSLGEDLHEPLGNVWMEWGVHAECMLSRALEPGEFILAIDMETGGRLRLATKVIDPTPQNMTICFLPGVFVLQWEEVLGADHYNIYESDDPELFPADPTYTAFINEFGLPMMPNEKLFYRVTAER
jgi:hypothetical protein